MKRFTSALKLLSLCIFALFCAVARAQTPSDFVTPLGNALKFKNQNAYFWCAYDVTLVLPDFAPDDTDETRKKKWLRAEADNAQLLANLKRAGFNMVRLANLPTGTGVAVQGSFTLAELRHNFIWRCKTNGIKIWADALVPNIAAPAVPTDVVLLDDPGTFAAWTNAVAKADAKTALLPRGWDPRCELLLQLRVREWAREFNPYTGLRRCDDSVYALWSFEQPDWPAAVAESLDTLPEFFASTLAVAWNNWLYRRLGTDEKLAAALDDLQDGESLDAGTVRFASHATASAKRRRLQHIFLRDEYQKHMSRVVNKFSELGDAARKAPRFVTPRESAGYKHKLSTVLRTDKLPETAGADPVVFVAPSGHAATNILQTALDAGTREIAVVAIRGTHYTPELRFGAQIFALHDPQAAEHFAKHNTLDAPALGLTQTTIAPELRDIRFRETDTHITDIKFRALKKTDRSGTDSATVPVYETATNAIPVIVSVAAQDRREVRRSDAVIFTLCRIDDDADSVGLSLQCSLAAPWLKGNTFTARNRAGDITAKGIVESNEFNVLQEWNAFEVEFRASGNALPDMLR